MANIRGLDDLGSGSGGDSDHDDDVNDYYAGGKER
jgi:hypothetical protein